MSFVTLTDSGLETWLVFHQGVDLPDFASFPLLDDHDGRRLLEIYFRDHLDIAVETGAAIVLETPTWRANPDWGARLGYDAAGLDRINQDAVRFVRDIAAEYPDVTVTVSGNLGPRGDGYSPAELLSPEVAAEYHRAQLEAFATAGADRATLLTATHPGEAIGVLRAARDVGLRVVIAFTVETDGRLPNGQPLDEAIEQIDAATGCAALAFGINCAHPDHFAPALVTGSEAIARIELIRANASRASHDELDAATELDDGDPAELGQLYATLLASQPHLSVLGGCCGTDARHVRAIAQACAPSLPIHSPEEAP